MLWLDFTGAAAAPSETLRKPRVTGTLPCQPEWAGMGEVPAPVDSPASPSPSSPCPCLSLIHHLHILCVFIICHLFYELLITCMHHIL